MIYILVEWSHLESEPIAASTDGEKIKQWMIDYELKQTQDQDHKDWDNYTIYQAVDGNYPTAFMARTNYSLDDKIFKKE